jgi:hypothetical protein
LSKETFDEQTKGSPRKTVLALLLRPLVLFDRIAHFCARILDKRKYNFSS